MKKRVVYDPHLRREVVIHESLEFALIVGLVLLGLAFIGIVGVRLTTQEIPFQAMVYCLASFALMHAAYVQGWPRSLCFVGLTAIIAFASEYFGVHTGAIFGRYVYTRELGPELLGTVPIVILPSYFMVLYPGYVMGNLLMCGRSVNEGERLPRLLWASLLTAAISTAWDLTLEPAMVHEAKAWVWLNGGPYFGIPFQNYYGWIVTTFAIALAYRLLERKIPMRPLGRALKPILLMPLLGYAGLCVGDVLVADPTGTRVVAAFAMGIPLVASMLRLYEPL